MAHRRVVRLGIMGFGQIGRQVFDLASQTEDIQVVAIADFGQADVLHYLLRAECADPQRHRLEGNFLVNESSRARLMQIDRPIEMPWDVFDVDLVIDATGQHRESSYLQDHLANGAPRVLLRTLPGDAIDRLVVPGVNEASVQCSDRKVSAGSATTSALAVLLSVLDEKLGIACASATSIHAYTSDQMLQDYASGDLRRSRSAAKNIIPNGHEAAEWIPTILPNMAGKVTSSALNVPVHEGCLLDTNIVIDEPSVDVADIDKILREAAARRPDILGVADDPIVSSDVIGSTHTLLYDSQGTIKAGQNTIKILGWYESRGHAARLLDVARLYADLDARSAGEVA
ncbi:glyceraldehyde 3-phosphate dehydrogenase NAD-binding domain-containing protein [Halioglobus pacificus]|uniref:Glyceraldehyde-3-phosphate dehydrogenase n=1 Tax=Parahalioglobus pacificus TaxID=930806 RepID=A0A918XI59_9GAMM|nr:glyceraldehyde 3-phosphate dehydrogenase NAD-binding domain-containing protein [Halioglobus pacificus]GHD31826.1 glyceraldehyde-3-phosphate dehydrogenase [Halioglobus pacificus]